nr:LuxR C-terminal-related transcriptional regulator [uncultured Rhodoferax sp.]
MNQALHTPVLKNDSASARIIRPRLYLGKLSPPLRPLDVVVRERLIEKLMESDKPVTLLMAPAGFGKTMLMSQCHERLVAANHSVAWLSLDDRDNDFSRFFLYLRESILGLGLFAWPPSPHSPFAHDNAFSDLRAESYEFVDSIAASPSPFTLFLDEFESIHSADVLSFFRELIRSLNPGQHVVIGSRSMRTMPLATVEVSGRLFRLDTADLMFDSEEVSTFFRNHGHSLLTSQEISIVQEKTEGWAAALRMITLALPALKDTRTWLEDLSGQTDNIAQYLAENVLARLPDHVCSFMLETSILENVYGNLCDAVLMSDGSSFILDEIYKANLFLTIVDPKLNSYEFHSLFRTYLLTELRRTRPAIIPTLHRRAAVFYSSSTRYPDALEHAIKSQDSPLAVDILDLCAMRFVELGQLETVAKWIELVDSNLIQDRDNIQRARAYASIARHQYADAQDALNKLRNIATRQGKELDAEATMQLALMYEWMDRHDLSEPEVTRMAAQVSTKNHLAFSISRNMMGYLAMLKLDYAHAQQALEATKCANEQCGFGSWSSTYTTCFEGVLEMTLGNARGALQRFEAGRSQASSGGQSIPSAYLADALYYKGELARAGSLAEEHLRLNRQIAPPDIVILSYRTAARVSFLNGNFDHAELLLTELGDIGDMRDLNRVKATAWLEKSRIALLCGDTESATRYFNLGVNPKIWDPFKDAHHYSQELDDAEIASMRMDLVLGEAESAACRLEAAIKQSERTGRRWRRIRLQCLLAQAYSRMRKQKVAADLLEIALLSAEKNGLVHIFADEPWCLFELLKDIAKRPSKISSEYLDRVVASTDHVSKSIGELSVSKKRGDILTLKETGLLKLVADGKSNKEIARILHITDNTVETHLRRINQKFDTKNRTQAVSIAREQGVLK